VLRPKEEDMMDAKKKKKLEDAGWKIGDAKDFLGLTPRELEYIELKMSLARSLSRIRKEKNITQIELAKRLGSSQSRIAKMEAADPSVSIDLLVKSLIELDVSKKQLSKLIV
jgi:DNA-binding XRE family transcriptional regulator